MRNSPAWWWLMLFALQWGFRVLNTSFNIIPWSLFWWWWQWMGTVGVDWEYVLDGAAVSHRTSRGNLAYPSPPSCFLGIGRKPEKREETHTDRIELKTLNTLWILQTEIERTLDWYLQNNIWPTWKTCEITLPSDYCFQRMPSCWNFSFLSVFDNLSLIASVFLLIFVQPPPVWA